MSKIFNNLVTLVKRLIKEQQEVVEQQHQQTETLEGGIYQLLDQLPGAVISNTNNSRS